MRVWPVVVAFLSFPLLTARVEARSESMQLNSTCLGWNRMCQSDCHSPTRLHLSVKMSGFNECDGERREMWYVWAMHMYASHRI